MLAKVRMARGLTQEELAEAIGVSLPTLRRLERKMAENPGLRYLTNAALALGVDLDALIEPEWRQWKVFDRQHPKPPDQAEFWRRPYPPGQTHLNELRRRGVIAEAATNPMFLQAFPSEADANIRSTLKGCRPPNWSAVRPVAPSCCAYNPRSQNAPVRFQPPDRLIGATAYARDDALRGAMNTVSLVKV